jgi:transposase
MHEPISFRYGIDGTAAIARLVLEKEPMDGAFFVFRGKMGHSLRVLHYDGSGYWLATKRLSVGKFNKVWPKAGGPEPDSPLLARELQILIWGGDPNGCTFPDLWRKVG